MQGRAPRNIEIVRPMRDGVIADFVITERMLGMLIKKATEGRSLVPPRVVICVPGGSTQVERKAILDSAFAAGAASVHLIEEPMAAALGAGLPIEDAAGSMIVDIGGGTTEIGILSLGGMAYSASVRAAGDEFDKSIIHYLRRHRGVLIGEATAEELKKQIGSASGFETETAMRIKGRDLAEGTPKSLAVTSDEIREALSETVKSNHPCRPSGFGTGSARIGWRHRRPRYYADRRRRASARYRYRLGRRNRPAVGIAAPASELRRLWCR